MLILGWLFLGFLGFLINERNSKWFRAQKDYVITTEPTYIRLLVGCLCGAISLVAALIDMRKTK